MPALKITNPHENQGDNTTMIQTRVAPSVFNYLFRGALVGGRGYRQAIVNIFLDALAKECKEQGVPNHFDENNESRIAAILERINFRPESPTAEPKPRRSSRTRRADPPPAESPA